MERVRLMDAPEDFTRLGVSPDGVEPWEDQRRDTDEAGHWEWWYFDAILDDGTTVVVQFFTKAGQAAYEKQGDSPHVSVTVTAPDGTRTEQRVTFKPEKATYGTGSCDVRIGPHRFAGDLKRYDVHVDPIDGLAADLHLTSTSTPYRPGTAYFGFGDHDEHYYTWLCVVPRGEITGTITVDGQSRKVHGRGYHDHQWGSINYLTSWNHWTWARQSYDDYSMLVFDMTSTPQFGFQRYPICFIQDDAGRLVFESTSAQNATVDLLEEYTDEATGKPYPKRQRYTFDNDGAHVVYELGVTRVIEAVDVASQVRTAIRTRLGAMAARLLGGFIMRRLAKQFEKQGVQPSYARYVGSGTLDATLPGAQTIHRTGELIYEFMYPAKTFRARP